VGSKGNRSQSTVRILRQHKDLSVVPRAAPPNNPTVIDERTVRLSFSMDRQKGLVQSKLRAKNVPYPRRNYMRAYRSQIINYLTDYEKARTTDEILGHVARQKGETVHELTERRRRSILTCLHKLEKEKVVLCKKSKDGVQYWASSIRYLDNIDNPVSKIPLKDLVRNARKDNTRRPVRFFQG
jgi:hypothetical protein